MKYQILSLLVIMASLSQSANAQTTWKLTKNSHGIAVYEGKTANSSYKSIKVECTFEGTYDRLISVLSNVSEHKEWVYNNKSASMLKQNSPNDFYYYTETTLPWPMSNRDAVMHTTIIRDSLNRFLIVHSTADATYAPEKDGKVRVKSSRINWQVTMPTATTIHVVYTLEADPGGSIPTWLVNSFVEKGPYESFKKLKELLKQS